MISVTVFGGAAGDEASGEIGGNKMEVVVVHGLDCDTWQSGWGGVSDLVLRILAKSSPVRQRAALGS